jgi:hypothetical protein
MNRLLLAWARSVSCPFGLRPAAECELISARTLGGNRIAGLSFPPTKWFYVRLATWTAFVFVKARLQGGSRLSIANELHSSIVNSYYSFLGVFLAALSGAEGLLSVGFSPDLAFSPALPSESEAVELSGFRA